MAATNAALRLRAKETVHNRPGFLIGIELIMVGIILLTVLLPAFCSAPTHCAR